MACHTHAVECLVKKGANISMKDKAPVGMTKFLNYGRWGWYQTLNLL